MRRRFNRRLAERSAEGRRCTFPSTSRAARPTGREIMQAHSWALLMTADAEGAPLGHPSGAALAGRRQPARLADRPHGARQRPLEAVRARPPIRSRCSGARTPMSRRPGTRRAPRCRPGTTSRCMPMAGRRSSSDTKGVLIVLARLAAALRRQRRRRLGPRPPAARQCRGADHRASSPSACRSRASRPRSSSARTASWRTASASSPSSRRATARMRRRRRKWMKRVLP